MENVELFKQLNEKLLVNINGDIFRPDEAKISIFDRGFLFGDSIYEVCYGVKRQLIFFEEHLNRLFNSAELIKMTMFLKREELIQQVFKTLKLTAWNDTYLRIIVTRGETAINLDPTLSFKNNFVIVVGEKPQHPSHFYKHGIKLFIADTLRNNPKSVDPNAKSGSYLNNVMALAEAKKVGADDALMLNHQGEVTEGTNFNIWLVKDHVFITPPSKSGLLKGITRQKVIELLKQNRLSYSERVIYLEDLLQADEVFITSSTRGIMPVQKINQTSFGRSHKAWPHTNQIAHLLQELIKSTSKGMKYCY